MNPKFDKLKNAYLTYGNTTEDYIELFPLIMELVGIKKEDLPYLESEKRSYVIEHVRNAQKQVYATAAQNKVTTATDEMDIYNNAYKIVNYLAKEEALDRAIATAFPSYDYSYGGSDDTPEETKEVDIQAEYIASNPILEKHSDEIGAVRDGITIYKPLDREEALKIYTPKDPTLDYIKAYEEYLGEYYKAAFGYFDRKIAKVQNPEEEKKAKELAELEKFEEEAKKKYDAAKDNLKKFMDAEESMNLSPEDFEKKSNELNAKVNKAFGEYKKAKQKLAEAKKNLESAKQKTKEPSVPLLKPAKPIPELEAGKDNGYPALPPGKDNDYPALPPGKGEIIPSEEPTLEPSKEPTIEISEPSLEPTKEPTEEPTLEPPTKGRSGRRLEVILNELIEGLGIKKTDNKAYNLSNIKVNGTFKNKLKQGNYLYNVVAGLNIGTYLSIPINAIKKLIGKIRMTKSTAERVETLKSRINSLSEEDLMVIYKEYRADRSQQNRDMDLVNTLLGERIAKFVEQKVAEINAKITELYTKVINDFKRIVELGRARQDETDPAKIAALDSEADALFEGKASDIAEIERLQREGREWYSGGAHGFEEDMKAARTKMSMKGRRFSKSNNSNEELSKEEASLVTELDEALLAGDNEKALYTFLKKEKLLSDNTIIKNSIFGKRSVGDRYYEPLVTKVDYRNDPFVTDLMGAVATVGGIINLAGQIRNIAQVKEAAERANGQIDKANDALSQAERQAHSYGRDIRGDSKTTLEGQQAQMTENELAHMNTAERASLDENNWVTGTQSYRSLDDATHAAYNQRYAEIQSQVGDVASKYQAGTLSAADALEQMTQIANQQQNGFIEMLENYQPTLIEYAASHPQFDLTGLLDGVDKMINNPYSIADMYAAQADIARIGEELEHLSLCGDLAGVNISMQMWPTVVGVGSAYVMACQVAQTMQNNAINGRYGNEVIDMISSLNSEDLEDMHR